MKRALGIISILMATLASGRGITFDVDERGYQRDLKGALFATQCRSGRQCRDLIEGPGELRHSLHQR